MRPAEFWNAHPIELWWLVEAKKPKPYYSGLTEEEYEDCCKEIEEWKQRQPQQAAMQ